MPSNLEKMHRRGFRTLLASAVAVAVVNPIPMLAPARQARAWARFDPMEEHGMVMKLIYDGGLSRGERQQITNKVVGWVHQSANAELPPRWAYELRRSMGEDYGRSVNIAWYRCPGMGPPDSVMLDGVPVAWRVNALGGYLYGGRFETRAA